MQMMFAIMMSGRFVAGSIADRAGVLVGDVIVTVNDSRVSAETQDTVRDLVLSSK
jgi:C-terminal processing protease CtpA/Prc